MSQSGQKKVKTDLTGEILKESLNILQRLSSTDEDGKEDLWQQFIGKYAGLEAHLMPSKHAIADLKDYEIIFEQKGGNIVLQFCPDRGIPWLGRYMEDMTDNILVMVDEQRITFQSMFYWFRMNGYLDTLMEKAIDAAILTRSHKETEIPIEDEEIQHAADIFRKAHGLLTPEETHAWLEKNNMSIEDFEDFIKRNLFYEKTFHHITDNKIEPYFSAHKNALDTALLAHIIVDDRSLAQKIIDDMRKAPERWAALAREHSIDEDTSETGGWLGLISRSDMTPEMADLVFSASAGDVVGPLKTKNGLEIVLVHDVRKAQLDERTRQKIGEKMFSDWIAELRSKVHIHWFWYQQ